MRTPSAAPVARPDRIPWLDFFRALAAYMVVICHLRGVQFLPYGDLPGSQKGLLTSFLYFISRMGHEGVLIFFVLSGYLVGGRALQMTLQGVFQPSLYVRDRVARIYPPLILSILFMIATGPYQNAPDSMGIGTLAVNLVGLQGVLAPSFAGNVVLWSLAYEIWFYVLCLGVCNILSSRGTGRTPVFSFLALSASFLVFSSLQPHYLLCWVAGAVFRLIEPARRFSAARLFLTTIGFSGSLVLSQLVVKSNAASFGFRAFLPAETTIDTLVCLAFCSLLYSVFPLREPRWVRSVSAVAADFSYSLYLLHLPILAGLALWVPPVPSDINLFSTLGFFAKLALCIFGAYLLYLPGEKQTSYYRRLLGRILPSDSGRPGNQQTPAHDSGKTAA